MADYTAFVEADNALLDMLRDKLTPEPLRTASAIIRLTGTTSAYAPPSLSCAIL